MAKVNQSPIRSSYQAANEAKSLKSVWSAESHLTLKVLIYVAELLERRGSTRKGKKSAWSRFLSIEMKKGKTVQACAAEWKARKAKVAQ